MGINEKAHAEFKDHPRHGAIHGFVASSQAVITARQNTFYLSKNPHRFFQGPPLLDEGVADGMADIQTYYMRKRNDNNDTWYKFDPETFKFGQKIPVNMRTDEYDSIDTGSGFIIIWDFVYPGLGPDAYGSYGDHWYRVHDEGGYGPYIILDEWYITDYPY